MPIAGTRTAILSGSSMTWAQLMAMPNLKIGLRPDRGVFTNAAAYFTAASQEYLTIADNAALSMGDIDFTMWCWVNMTSKPAATMNPMTKWNTTGSQRAYEFRWNNANDRFDFLVSPDGTANTAVTASNFGTPSLSTWYLLLAWHDSVANTINISVNDGTVNSVSYSTGVFDNTAAFQFGMIGNLSGGVWWDGSICLAGITKQVLTAAQRTALYNSGNGANWDDINAGTGNLAGINNANLVAFWNLSEDEGATRSDSKGTNHVTPNTNTLATNGTFTGNSTGWTEGAGWAYNVNNEIAVAASSDLSQTVIGNVKDVKTYKLTYVISSYTGGTVTPYIGGVAGVTRSANGTITLEAIVSGTTDELVVFRGVNFSGIIDGVAVFGPGPTRVAGVQDPFQVTVTATPVAYWQNQASGSSNHFTQTTLVKRPVWTSNVWGTNPSVQFDSVDDILVNATAFLTGATGWVCALVKLTAVSDTYQIILSSSDEAVAETGYFIIVARANNANLNLQSEFANSGGDAVGGGAAIASATTYVMAFASDGSITTLQQNGSALVTVGANTGKWVSAVASNDNVVIGALKLDVQAYALSGHLGPIIVEDGTYTPSLLTAAINLCTKYSLGGAI